MFLCACRAFGRLQVTVNTSYSKCLASGYKSQVSLENLYPNSNQNRLANIEFKHTSSLDKDTEEKPAFSGYIPIDEVRLQYSRSGGPGGQNVNKVNTKVEVRFNVDEASWIPSEVKARLKEQQQGRITKQGELIVTSEKTRKQLLNQADCMDKLRHMVYQACIKPREPTKEELELQQKRLETSKRKVLQEKRQKSMLKQSRRSNDL